MSFEGKNLYAQYIDFSEKKKMALARASSAPILGLFSITFVYTVDLRSAFTGPLVLWLAHLIR